jgi:hypothetical protein
VTRAVVVIDRLPYDGEVEAVRAAFQGIDADVTVESAIELRGAGDYPWVVVVTLLGITVGSFFNKLGGLLAEDAHEAVKLWVGSVVAARRRFRSTRENIEIGDAHISRIVLHDALPDEAFIALVAMDLDALPDGAHLHWDDETGEWKGT